MRRMLKYLVPALISAFILGHPARAESPTEIPYTPSVGQEGKDVIWVPTDQEMVEVMLDMAELTPEDRLVDLGSGDGRTVITAAKRGISARGIEYNPDMVALAQRQARLERVSDKAVFEQADIFESDFSEATVVTLFLLPTLNVRLRPTLLDMAPGTRVLSNSFDMDDWTPDETRKVTEDCQGRCDVHKWVVPAKVGGTWTLGKQELVLDQTYQVLDGSLNDGANGQAISDARLNGSQIQFTVAGKRYEGVVNGNEISGTIDGQQKWNAKRTGSTS